MIDPEPGNNWWSKRISFLSFGSCYYLFVCLDILSWKNAMTQFEHKHTPNWPISKKLIAVYKWKERRVNTKFRQDRPKSWFLRRSSILCAARITRKACGFEMIGCFPSLTPDDNLSWAVENHGWHGILFKSRDGRDFGSNAFKKSLIIVPLTTVPQPL